MAFPSANIADAAVTEDASPASSTFTVTLPANVVSGDMIGVLVESRNQDPDSLTGYTEKINRAYNSNYCSLFMRDANGTEGSTVDVTFPSTPDTVCAIAFRIDGHSNGVAEVETATTGSSTTSTPDGPSITASWGADDNLVINVCGSGRFQRTYTNAPSGYSGLTEAAAHPGDSTSSECAIAYIETTSATEDAGTWTLSGSDQCMPSAIIIQGTGGPTYTLALGQGSFVLSGQAVGLAAARKLSLGQGSHTLNGQGVGLLAGRTLALAQGSFSVSGQAVGLKAGRKVALAQGSFALGGQTLGILANRVLSAQQGSYSLTGQDVGLVYSAAAATYTLVLSAGAFALTGQAVGLMVSRKLAAAQGAFTLTGQSANLLAGRHLAAEQGGYVLSGQNAGLRASRKLPLAQGNYSLSGQAAGTLVGRKIAIGQGSYSLAGQSTSLRVARQMVIEQGSYTLSGQDVDLLIPALATSSRTFNIGSRSRSLNVKARGRVFYVPNKSRSLDA